MKTRQLNAEDVEVRREVLIERLIERQLLRAFLAQKKIAADARLLQEHVTRIKLRLKGQGEDFEKVLAKVGLNEDSLRRELSLPLDWDAYAKQIVTDTKVREVWKERAYEFDGSEVWASHIVLQSDQPEADENSLREIRKQITTGKLSFAEAAKKYSHPEAPSRTDGGKLGRFGFRGKQPPPYPQIAFGLKIGEVSEPFRSPFGVHILIVTERAAGQLSLEDARPEIQHQLSVELQEEVLKQERLKAKIEPSK